MYIWFAYSKDAHNSVTHIKVNRRIATSASQASQNKNNNNNNDSNKSVGRAHTHARTHSKCIRYVSFPCRLAMYRPTSSSSVGTLETTHSGCKQPFFTVASISK